METERLSNFPDDTQLVSGGARTVNQAVHSRVCALNLKALCTAKEPFRSNPQTCLGASMARRESHAHL